MYTWYMFKRYGLVASVIVLAAYVTMTYAVTGYEFIMNTLVEVFSAVVAIKLAIDIVKDLARGKFGVDILALVAIGATIVAGEYAASLAIILMLAAGEILERHAKNRARRELTKLLHDKPRKAHVVGEDGQREDVAAAGIKTGEILLIKTGEMVPIDGELVSTMAVLDTSGFTGEELPVEVKRGGLVMSGSVNIAIAFQMSTTTTFAKSQYSQMVKLVEGLEKRPAKLTRQAGRYALAFTVVAFGVAGFAWWASGDFLRFAGVLVVASPCSLILAVPMAFVSGISNASRSGVMVKGGMYLEKLARVRSVVFDKTGALLKSGVRIDKVVSLSGRYSEQRIIQMIASCERESTHALARSIAKYAKVNGIRLVNIQRTRDHAGLGEDSMYDGKQVIVGNVAHLMLHKIDVSRLNYIDRSAVFLVVSREIVGLVTFKDTIRENASDVASELRKMEISNIAVVTGDTERAAEVIAGQMGVEDVYASVSLTEKVRIVKDQVEQPALFVGDGVNDVPVLAAAEAGVVVKPFGYMTVSKSVGVVIMADDLGKVPMILQIARKTIGAARGSMAMGMLASIVLMALAGFGLAPVIAGAILHGIVDVAAILNALRAHR